MIDVLCCRVEQAKKCTEREQYIVMCKSILTQSLATLNSAVCSIALKEEEEEERK